MPCYVFSKIRIKIHDIETILYFIKFRDTRDFFVAEKINFPWKLRVFLVDGKKKRKEEERKKGRDPLKESGSRRHDFIIGY